MDSLTKWCKANYERDRSRASSRMLMAKILTEERGGTFKIEHMFQARLNFADVGEYLIKINAFDEEFFVFRLEDEKNAALLACFSFSELMNWIRTNTDTMWDFS